MEADEGQYLGSLHASLIVQDMFDNPFYKHENWAFIVDIILDYLVFLFMETLWTSKLKHYGMLYVNNVSVFGWCALIIYDIMDL